VICTQKSPVRQLMNAGFSVQNDLYEENYNILHNG